MNPLMSFDGRLLAMCQQADKLPGPLGVGVLPNWLNVIKHGSLNALG